MEPITRVQEWRDVAKNDQQPLDDLRRRQGRPGHSPGFLDDDGAPVSVEFPFDQAEQIVMTLPQMLSKALQGRTRSQSSRYVFSLGRWTIESSDEKSLIVTLGTGDGFQVSFVIPFDACRAIGWALGHEGRSETERDSIAEPIDDSRLLN